MEIIIDIPDSFRNSLLEGSLTNDQILDVYRSVRNGVILPKGYGRLIDINDLLVRIELEDNDSNREDNVGEIITLEDFDFIPTIIEADTESEE
jgi:hypothetical protein